MSFHQCKGLIQPLSLAEAYKQGGAHIFSVLTGEQYFQGSLEYLEIVSGVGSAEDVKRLMNYGVKGFLVGESLMRQEDVKAAAIELFRGVF
jgi:indole-3-glycerol phosphate synthase